MTWTEKLLALNSLQPDCFGIPFYMREDETWWCNFHAEVKEDRMLASPVSGADTVQGCVERLWEAYCTGQHVVVNAYDSEKRRDVKWCGYMWRDIPKEDP